MLESRGLSDRQTLDELRDTRRMVALLVVKLGGKVHITRKEIDDLDTYTITRRNHLPDGGIALYVSHPGPTPEGEGK